MASRVRSLRKVFLPLTGEHPFGLWAMYRLFSRVSPKWVMTKLGADQYGAMCIQRKPSRE